jgi:hypothetical protein
MNCSVLTHSSCQEDKADLERLGENGLGQEGLERCDCGLMPPGGQKVKKNITSVLCTINMSTSEVLRKSMSMVREY